MRITKKMLNSRVEMLNNITGNNPEPYTEKNGRLVANIGNFHISGAYGGHCLQQMCNESGGVNSPLSQCHIPKKELFSELCAFIAGIEHAKRGL
jgi:hypothetical protein